MGDLWFGIIATAAVEGNPSISDTKVPSYEVIQELQEEITEPTEVVEPAQFSFANPKNVYVIAPHPDDEVLCCGLTIEDQLQKGNQVRIVFITGGGALQEGNYYESQNYALTRQRESINAGRAMGVRNFDMFFLDFPDGMLNQLGDTPLVSKYTGKDHSIENARYGGSPYTEAALIQNLTNIFRENPPDIIYLPSSWADKHPDHRYTGQIVTQIIENSSYTPSLWYYVVHGRFSGKTETISERKLKLIQFFNSQFHDEKHKAFLEKYAWFEEKFWK